MSTEPNNNETNPSDEARLKKDLERQLRAQLANVTGGLAPDDYLQAWWDWYLNLSKEPDKQFARGGHVPARRACQAQ